MAKSLEPQVNLEVATPRRAATSEHQNLFPAGLFVVLGREIPVRQ